MQRANQGFWSPRSLSLVCAAVLTLASSAEAQFIPPNAKPTCTVAPPVFAGWFATGAPSLNGVVNPANSVTFSNTPNCEFYRWSEQMYLWATSPAPPEYGGGGGRIFDSSAFFDVSPPSATGQRIFIPHPANQPVRPRVVSLRAAQAGPHGLPVIFARSGQMLEIEPLQLGKTGRPLVHNQAGDLVEFDRAIFGRDDKPIFLDVTGKPVVGARPAMMKRPDAELKVQSSSLDRVQKLSIEGRTVFLNASGTMVDVEQGQAGGGGVLVSQNGSLVYYATMVNDVYAYFLTGTKNGGIVPTPTQFPTTVAELNAVVAFAAAHGTTFPDPNALAVEIKTAWVEAASVPDPQNYIIMTATIPTYDTSDPNKWVPNGQKTVDLAMVGMHVVGSTAGHPEMIWATWEHLGNAPNATYAYINTSGALVIVPQSTAGTWLFSSSGSPGPFNQQHAHFVDPNIISDLPFTISPSDTIRWKAWGGAFDFSPNPLDPTTAASNTEIIAINNSVSTQMPAGDVRNNYFMTGATWTIGGAAPTGSFKAGAGGNEVGTSKLANSTLETYQQGIDNKWASGSNCFSCHGTNTVHVSHIYDPLQPLF